MKGHILGLALALATSGCVIENDLQPLDVPDGCNPLAHESDCLLPYPSDFFIEDGLVAPAPNALALFETGEPLDMLALHRPTAFSVGNQIMALFPDGVDEEPLVGPFDDLEKSLGDESPTIVLDAETGDRILHLAELDPRADDDARRALVIRPLERLRNDARYIVAIRGLSDKNGDPIVAPEGFRRLREGRTAADDVLAQLAPRYESGIFPQLEEAGIERSTLQLAWDFTTQPIEETTGDMLAVRDLVVSYFSENTPELQVVSVEDDPDGEAEHTFRRIELTVTVPLVMESTEPYAAISRDEEGNVAQNGTVDVAFTVLIPQSLRDRPPGSPPVRVMQFGHGFFGGRDEINYFADTLADERDLVVVATDWWGMTEEDRTAVADRIVSEPDTTMAFTDRLHQGMANFMAVAYAAQGPLVDLAELQPAGEPLFDPSSLFYYGISQGGILGGTYMGITPNIDKGILSVGGANFSFMMFRARPFLAFLAILQVVSADPLDQQKFTMFTQTSFDRVEPITYAPWVLDNPTDVGPDSRQVLMQIAIGDDQVPNFASHLHARAMGIPLLEPANRSIPALESGEGPLPSALVEFDFGVPEPLPGTVATPSTEETEGHEGVRRLDAAKEQLDRFATEGGEVEHTCDGACDPE
jgi:hypothetical protein